MDFNMIIERIGFPAAVLLFLSIALWRILVWVGNKVVLPVTTSHIDLVNEIKINNKVNTEANRLNAESNKKIGEACDTQAKTLQTLADALKK